MYRYILFQLLLGVLIWQSFIYADQTITSKKVTVHPVLDGISKEVLWQNIKSVQTFNPIDRVNIEIKPAFSDTDIFFNVSFKDSTESRLHKSWVWNKEDEVYDVGLDREDTFVFKWAIQPFEMDLNLKNAVPSTSDVWFWKAHRTDPLGFADDKLHIISIKPKRKSISIRTNSGENVYFIRKADNGSAAYKGIIPDIFTKPKITNYIKQVPSGSRADVRAKGQWQNGVWTIEFSRKLVTGHKDDVQFKDLKRKYLFGVAVNEIAGRKPKPQVENPNYGAGEVGESLYLQFESK